MTIITNFKLFEKITSREELMSNSLKKDGLIEPALMTSSEYLEYLGANKQHPSSAYQFSLADDDSHISDNTLKEKYTLLNTIKHESIYIKYYVNSGKDFLKSNYVKLDSDGDIMRDDKGLAILMTRAEIDKAGYTYGRDIIAVHNNNIVGSAQDEWGCVLIYVVKELKSVGIGQQLTKFYRSYYPNKTSGGTTPNGYRNLRKYHMTQIKLYLRNGIYSDMVRNGEITSSRVKEITDSISNIKSNNRKKSDNIYVKYSQSKLNYNKVFLFGGNDIMMINDDIIPYYDDYDKQYNEVEDTYEDFIFGHTRIHISDDNSSARLYFIDGKTEKDILDLINYTMSYVNMRYGFNNLIYYITESTTEIVKNVVLNTLKSEIHDIPNGHKIILNNIDKGLVSKLKDGTNWFYSLDDKYGQLKDKIAENVYSAFQQ